MICEVIINSKALELNKPFDYLVPENFLDVIKVGQRVFVPFGSTKNIGYVTKLKDNTSYKTNKIKSILEIIDEEPLLTNDDLELANYISKRYFTSLGKSLELMIPIGLRQAIKKNLKLLDIDKLPDSLKNLFIKSDEIYYDSKLYAKNKDISLALKNKAIEVKYILSDKGKMKEISYVKFVSPYNGRSNLAKELSKYLSELGNEVPKAELIKSGYSISSINTLKENGNIEIFSKEEYRNINVLDEKYPKVTLNSEQEHVYNEIKKSLNKYDKFLIHGVCGSGKTEIYLNLIEDVLNSGKNAIMLVPEISLTPQMASRFKSRFDNLVAIMHSRLSINERYDEYRRIKRGEARVLLGARSAMFSPIDNVGIIIMDEEQEESYVQDSTPAYDTHDIIEFKAKKYNCPIVLGSATPKVSTYYLAKMGEYKLLNLYKRANNKPQESSVIVDMRNELKSGNKSVFSSILKENLIENYNKNEQSILFINRRGFSSFVMCRSCGETIKCPNCDVSLTYHKSTNSLRCHYCNYSMPSPNICPKCSSKAIKFVSAGTEKVEEEIKNILPEAKVIRMDQDTTKTKNGHKEIIEAINNHEADILVGTQIVAKGLDFPLVSLVGVVNSDLGLNMPFYDAYEKTYDLIEQVSGRAGRKNTQGISIIQTYNPKNVAIYSASMHSYLAFYNDEIEKRRKANNPPFSSLIEILVTSQDQYFAYEEAKKIKTSITNNLRNCQVLGPCTDRIYKIDNIFRYIITIKAFDNANLDYLNDINEKYLSLNNIKIFIKRM